jgi:hypothetical protein
MKLRGYCFRAQTAWSGRQRGQALTEFLVVAFALVPLFLLIPVIAKYQDISHATQMASRYVAFDATTRNDSQSTWKPVSQVADEVRRRFYGTSNAPIKTNDVAGDFKAHQNLFWRDPQGNPLVENFSDVSVTFGGGNGGNHGDAFSGASDGEPYNYVPVANADSMGLRARGIYTANVSVALANLPEGIKSLEPFNKIDLSIRRHSSVVIDPWAARSPEQTEARFGQMVPLNQLLSSGIETMVGAAIRVFELNQVTPPKFGRLEQWRDVVPQDRLKPAS